MQFDRFHNNIEKTNIGAYCPIIKGVCKGRICAMFYTWHGGPSKDGSYDGECVITDIRDSLSGIENNLIQLKRMTEKDRVNNVPINELM